MPSIICGLGEGSGGALAVARTSLACLLLKHDPHLVHRVIMAGSSSTLPPHYSDIGLPVRREDGPVSFATGWSRRPSRGRRSSESSRVRRGSPSPPSYTLLAPEPHLPTYVESTAQREVVKRTLLGRAARNAAESIASVRGTPESRIATYNFQQTLESIWKTSKALRRSLGRDLERMTCWKKRIEEERGRTGYGPEAFVGSAENEIFRTYLIWFGPPPHPAIGEQHLSLPLQQLVKSLLFLTEHFESRLNKWPPVLLALKTSITTFLEDAQQTLLYIESRRSYYITPLDSAHYPLTVRRKVVDLWFILEFMSELKTLRRPPKQKVLARIKDGKFTSP